VIDHLPLAREAITKHLRLLEEQRSKAQKGVDQGRGSDDFQDWMQRVARFAAKEHRELTRALPDASGTAQLGFEAMSADGSGRTRRPFRMLLEREVAEIERRLRLYREKPRSGLPRTWACI
jgi:hypothetical protein